jgi:cell division protein YceG involved in septum cleavage
MIKWFAYIVLLLIFAPGLSSAKIKNNTFNAGFYHMRTGLSRMDILTDTIIKKNKKQEREEKQKIKEVARARRQPRPEKIEPDDNVDLSKIKAPKPKRQRRPEGLVRPPEIPRRNGN